MKNLMTRKLVFGMLIAFVLAFGVTGTGIAAPLKLTPRSDTTQLKRPNDAPFEIQFSVTFGGTNVIAYNDASPRRRVTDANTGAVRIDSSGYKVATVAGTERRIFETQPAPETLMPVGTPRLITLDNSPTSNYNSADHAVIPDSNWATPNGNYYVDSSNNVYDANGKAVYVRISKPATRTVSKTGEADVTVTDYTYSRAQFNPMTATNPVPVADRFDYNEEEIRVTIEKLDAAGTAYEDIAATDMDVHVKGSNYFVTSGTDLTEVSGVLKSSMTLVCASTTPNTYRITIQDSTEAKDYPRNEIPLEIGATTSGIRRSKIEFTLYVTTEGEVTNQAIVAQRQGASGPGVAYLRVDTGREIEHISSDFTVTGADLQIRYKVIRGRGTLYAAETSTTGTYLGPNQDLTVHRNANVFLNTNGTTNEVSASIAGSDRQTHTATIVYEYSGSDQQQQQQNQQQNQQNQQQQQQQQQRGLSLVPSTLEGAPGSSAPLTAIISPQAAGATVTFSINGVPLSQVPTNAAGQASTSIILPASNTNVIASSPGYGTAAATISVTGTAPPTTQTTPEPVEIIIYSGDNQSGEINQRLDEDLVVQVIDANGSGVRGELVEFSVVSGNGRLSRSRALTDRDGYANVSFTPRSRGMTIEVEASSGNLTPAIFTITTGEPPDAIVRVSGNNQSGRPGTRLPNPFVVEVVDENDEPLPGISVTFAVTAGGGRVSPTSATTNNGGRAQTTLTLGEAVGDNTVTASVAGVRTRVTFTASAGATVLVDSENRAPMYWVGKQKGTLHRLVDGEVENLAPAVTGVTSIAVDATNDLLYFAVQTGPRGGKLQRSRLNGRNVQTVKDKIGVPKSIALDAAGSTLYYATGNGTIRQMATEGSARVTPVLGNLANPTSFAVSNGYLYWAEPLGRVRRANLTADPIRPENLATGLGEPLSLAIAKGKVYWTERSGNGGAGKLQRANLNGTNIEELRTFAGGVPLGIAIDASDNKIYMTRPQGKIQRSNLAGRFIADVVNGLMSPGSIALGIAATPAPDTTQPRQPTRTTTPTTPTTPTTYSKYDINKDGAVNNRDTRLVAGAVGQSGAAIKNPRTDVNDSGTVDVTDLILVIANLDDDVAAPAIDIDLQAMDLDFDRVQEQVELLLSSGDRSHAAQRALLYLQHLLASARPDTTVLLANYPNPFNPETWIPYHLAESTDVKINIYNARGTLVRSLTLGHQSAGYYTSRSRAAYWDGRNALGERVASGIYFYQLQADEMSPLRKMVILK